jgi:hypothetical protein
MSLFTTTIGKQHSRQHPALAWLIPAMGGRCLLIVLLVFFAHSAVQACGYHQATVRIGILNWFYPNSLHVTGAIWKAQQAGELPWPDTERMMATGPYRKALDAAAFGKIQQALRNLGAAMGQMTPGDHTERFSLVLVEQALWSRFTLGRTWQGVVIDAGGPGDVGLVVVTGEPVIHAMVRGDLALSAAVGSGMVKLYGDTGLIDQFLSTFGGIGNKFLLSPH